MDRSLKVVCLVLSVAVCSCGPEIAFAPHHEANFEAFGAPTPPPPARLSNVTLEGTVNLLRQGECVDYARLATDPEARALARRAALTLGPVDPASLADGAERVAFWINAYNTLVLLAVSEAMSETPAITVADNGFAMLRTAKVLVAGHLLAPDWIHHGILRGDAEHVSLAGIDPETRRFIAAQSATAIASPDPRFHFALACGAESCPRLPPAPYTGAQLDAELDAATERFLADPSRGAGPDGVSPIFRWYEEDFAADGGFQRFLARFRQYESAARTLTLGWDWRPLIVRPTDPRCAPPVPEQSELPPGEGATDPVMGPVRECEEGALRPCGPVAERGICRPGQQLCGPDGWTACEGAVEATEETCDGRDEDCDGEIDEELARSLEETGCLTAGLCANSTTACRNGEWLCVTPPGVVRQESNCDGVDDDCDGRIDEDATPPPDLVACSGPGACATAVAACTDGQWRCEGFDVGHQPAGETLCDGIDNDCDALIDERLPQCVCPNGASRDCGVAIGACTVGQQTCTNGLWGPCSGRLPEPERCDAADNDCNGTVDDGVANACGACGPTPTERCNGVDDDCDELVDEGTTNACGGCGLAPTEVCNGQDDDCDGRVDEGVANDCGGCGGPAEEICNGLDDDCDESVDEGLTPPADIECLSMGVCARGAPACLGAEGFGCAYPRTYEAQEISCDFRDNDCDGLNDEGLLNDCDFCGPDPTELCNHLDDDCDGQEDEGCPIDPNSQPTRD